MPATGSRTRAPRRSRGTRRGACRESRRPRRRRGRPAQRRGACATGPRMRAATRRSRGRPRGSRLQTVDAQRRHEHRASIKQPSASAGRSGAQSAAAQASAASRSPTGKTFTSPGMSIAKARTASPSIRWFGDDGAALPASEVRRPELHVLPCRSDRVLVVLRPELVHEPDLAATRSGHVDPRREHLLGGLDLADGLERESAIAASRCRTNPSSTGIGFSHQSVPSLSKTATRSSGGISCAASAKETIACVVAVSCHDARLISRAPHLPHRPSSRGPGRS